MSAGGTITHVPWSKAEEDAYLALAAHCQGTDQVSKCGVCSTSTVGECEDGKRLRRELRNATQWRRREQR